jgi:hypothetical protein
MADMEKGIIERECVRKSTREDTGNPLEGFPPTIHSYKLEVRDVILSFRITRSLSERIETYRMMYKRMRRTEAAIQLLEAGVFLAEQRDKLEDPELVKYLRNHLYDVELVDEVAKWDQNRIDAILALLMDEKDRRIKLHLRKW